MKERIVKVLSNLSYTLRDDECSESSFVYDLVTLLENRMYNTAKGYIEDMIGDDDILDNSITREKLIDILEDIVVSKL